MTESKNNPLSKELNNYEIRKKKQEQIYIYI